MSPEALIAPVRLASVRRRVDLYCLVSAERTIPIVSLAPWMGEVV